MSKPSKDRRHGRRVHRPGGGCDTGRRVYATKREAELASGNGRAERCDRCRHFHADDDRPARRR